MQNNSILLEMETKKKKIPSNLEEERSKLPKQKKKREEGKKRLNLLNYCMAVSCFHDFSICWDCSRIRLKTWASDSRSAIRDTLSVRLWWTHAPCGEIKRPSYAAFSALISLHLFTYTRRHVYRVSLRDESTLENVTSPSSCE